MPDGLLDHLEVYAVGNQGKAQGLLEAVRVALFLGQALAAKEKARRQEL